jgi:pimeloyl-ACP methyl ester carboxylesterase
MLGAEFFLIVVLATIGFLYEQRSVDRDAQLYPPPGKLIDIGGYRLHFNCTGSGTGPTVVLEYGHQSSSFEWHQIQPEIAKFARVCFYDRAGYGWSDASPRPRVPSVMADELHSLLHAAGENPPYVLIAHSLASYNAVMFTHKFPHEVAGLVLVDGLRNFDVSPMGGSEGLALRAMQLLIPFGLPRWRGWCGGSGPEQLRGEKQAISCRASLYQAYYRERAAFPDSAQEMRTITDLGSIPLIVIAHDPKLGNMSEDFWQRVQDEKLGLSKNSELVIATGSDHDIPMKRPDVIVAAARKLVTQSPGTGGQPGNAVR